MAIKTITVKTIIHAQWGYWNKPKHIVHWTIAFDNWEKPPAENDLRKGGIFRTTMAAKDKCSNFNFTEAYTTIMESELMKYDLDDGGHITVESEDTPDCTKVYKTFETSKMLFFAPYRFKHAVRKSIFDSDQKLTLGVLTQSF